LCVMLTSPGNPAIIRAMKKKEEKKKMLRVGLVLCAGALVVPWLLRAWVHGIVSSRIYDQVQAVPPAGVALVLGAGLWADGTPTPVLYDRVATAAELYHAGVVKKLLMSGDNRFEWYNEPEEMRQLAIRLGVPDKDVVLDYAGRRTYDSCYRAKAIFEVEQVVIVTQRFHLDRALYLCNAMGIQSVGVVADRRVYSSPARQWWDVREVAALTGAWLDVHVLHPQPVLGEKLPIDGIGDLQEPTSKKG
jgi:SanA protein